MRIQLTPPRPSRRAKRKNIRPEHYQTSLSHFPEEEIFLGPKEEKPPSSKLHAKEELRATLACPWLLSTS